MLLYLDASAIVKLYVEEEHSELVAQAVDAADILSSVIIAYTEVQRTLFQRLPTEFQALTVEFSQHWQDYLVLPVDDWLVRHAAVLAQGYGLKTLDSLHLAAANFARQEAQEPFCFACFDRKLNAAASLLGLETLYHFPLTDAQG